MLSARNRARRASKAVRAVRAIRQGRVAAHQRSMTGAFIGLAIAGVFAMATPSRTIGAWLTAMAG